MSRLDVDRADYDTDGFELSDLDDDPMVEVRRWIEAALASSHAQPDAMALATVDTNGLPSVRSVLLKGLDHGFVFYTNYRSHKGRDLLASGVGAINLTWVALHRQIRADGRVERTSEVESDAYWSSRPRDAQLAAAASRQSEPIAGRSELETAVSDLDAELDGSAVPRPAWWGGFRLLPDRIELWQGRRSRMHDRALYTRSGATWSRARLAP